MKRVAIIGAGVSGLACAFRLGELARKDGAALEVRVFDSASRPGGVVRTETRDGFVLERGPDAFISEKPWVEDLARRLGIADRLLDTLGGDKRTFVVKNGKFVPLPDGFRLIAPTRLGPFVTTPLFSPLAKVRMASEVLIPKRKSGSDESIAGFIRRRFGNEALVRVGQPMIAGIHGGDPERLSADTVIPQFKELEERHGSVLRGLLKRGGRVAASGHGSSGGTRRTFFVSFDNGMETLIGALAAALPPETLQLGTPVSVERLPSGEWGVLREGNPVRRFDVVCLSMSARHAAHLLRTEDPDLSGRLGWIRFESTATLNLAYREEDIPPSAPDGFGFVVPAAEKRSFTACTFTTRKFAGRTPRGHALIRVFIGGAFGKKFFDMEDRDLAAAVTSDLKDLLGIRAEPLLHLLSRHAGVLPQYEVGHKAKMLDLEAALKKRPGLHLTGSSYLGTGVSNCVRNAEVEAGRIYEGILSGAAK